VKCKASLAPVLIDRRKEIFDASSGCINSLFLPAAISLPFFLRCRQCVVEYRATGLGKDLANFCKYATGLPLASRR
jgi:hypothetical protein